MSFLIIALLSHAETTGEASPTFAVLSLDAEVRTASGAVVSQPPLAHPSARMLFELQESADGQAHLVSTTAHIAGLDSLEWLHPYALSLYADTADLQPVLSSLHTHTGSDGLETLLLPGHAVTQESSGRYGFVRPELSAFGPLDSALVSDRFKRITLPEWMPVVDARVCRLDDGLLPPDADCWGYEKGYPHSMAQRAYRVRADEDGLIGLLRAEAGRFEDVRLLAESEHHDPILDSQQRSPLMSQLGAASDPVRLAAGIPLYWVDGAPAGRVRVAHEVSAVMLVERPGGLRCFELFSMTSAFTALATHSDQADSVQPSLNWLCVADGGRVPLPE